MFLIVITFYQILHNDKCYLKEKCVNTVISVHDLFLTQTCDLIFQSLQNNFESIVKRTTNNVII